MKRDLVGAAKQKIAPLMKTLDDQHASCAFTRKVSLMATVYLPTQGQVRLTLTASTQAGVHAYLDQNPSLTRPYIALDSTSPNPVLCFPVNNVIVAVPLVIGHAYDSLPLHYARLLRVARLPWNAG